MKLVVVNPIPSKGDLVGGSISIRCEHEAELFRQPSARQGRRVPANPTLPNRRTWRSAMLERRAESMRSIRFSGLKAVDPIHILRAALSTGFGGTNASVTTTRLSAIRG